MDIRGSGLTDPRCLDLRGPRCSRGPAQDAGCCNLRLQGGVAPGARVKPKAAGPSDPTSDKHDTDSDRTKIAIEAILLVRATIYGSFTVPRVTGPNEGQSAISC